MGEGFREGIASFVGMRRGRGVNMDVVVEQELLQHFTSSDEEIAVATLTPELERIIGGLFLDGVSIGIRLCVLEVGGY